MSTLTFPDTHNMVAFLEKPAESDGFHEIIDFLNANQIHYALTINPTIYTSCIVELKSSIRSDLHLEDADGTDCLPTATIFEELARMGHPLLLNITSKPRKKPSKEEADKDILMCLPPEDASKQGRSRIEAINIDAEVTLVKTQRRNDVNDDNLMFDTGVFDGVDSFVATPAIPPLPHKELRELLFHNESFRVDDLDLDLNLTLDLNVSQIKTQEEVPVSEVPNKEHVVVHVRVVDVVDGSGEEAVVHDSDEEAVEQGTGEEAVEQGNGEEAIEQGNGEEVVKETSGEQVEYDVVGIDSAYETQYYVESGDDAGTDDDDDFLVDKEIEIVEPDVDVHLFGIRKDVPFVGVTSVVLEDF
ncbi:hypothetical protein Tco_0394821 [Tanacetum coccineum]